LGLLPHFFLLIVCKICLILRKKINGLYLKIIYRQNVINNEMNSINEKESIIQHSFDNIINEMLQLCKLIIKTYVEFDSIIISIVETNQVNWLLLKNFSNELDMSFLPKTRKLRLTDSLGIVELTWITEKTLIYNSREDIIKATAISDNLIPSGLERVISFSINDFIFQLCRTANLPPFSEVDLRKINQSKQLLSKIVNVAFTSEKMKEQEKRREKALTMLFHDANNKLFCISGLIQIIDEGEFDMKIVNSLKENVSLLTSLNKEFQLTMLSDDSIPSIVKEFEINALIDEVIRLYYPYFQKKKQNLVIEMHDDIRIKSDYLGLKRVIDNLISNSIKYTPDKGEIKIQLSIDEKECKITISDTGLGLSENDQKLVFQKYSPVHQLAVIKERGLGLGLWTSQMIMNKLGGKINVYSEGRSKGSTFKIIIPIK
jgi:signal transduction histidine kinase